MYYIYKYYRIEVTGFDKHTPHVNVTDNYVCGTIYVYSFVNSNNKYHKCGE